MVRYRATLTPTQEGTYVAVVPEMAGICATGRTREDALERAADALRRAVRAALLRGETLAPPEEPAKEPYIEVSYGDLAPGSERS